MTTRPDGFRSPKPTAPNGSTYWSSAMITPKRLPNGTPEIVEPEDDAFNETRYLDGWQELADQRRNAEEQMPVKRAMEP